MFMFVLKLMLLILNYMSIVQGLIINYPNIGESLTLRCLQSGQFFCFSTYTYKNRMHPMIIINSTQKYQVSMGGSLTINNIDRTDAGYYACSSTCMNMRVDLIDFYVQPMQNRQPVNTNEFFLAIPPLNPDFLVQENYFVPFGQANTFIHHRSRLNGGEIAGIVIGCVAFVCLIALIIGFIIWSNRTQASLKRNKKQVKKNFGKSKRDGVENDEQSQDIDYTSVEKDLSGSKNDTYKSDKVLIKSDRPTRQQKGEEQQQQQQQQQQQMASPHLPSLQFGSKQSSYNSTINVQTNNNNNVNDVMAPKVPRQKEPKLVQAKTQENSYEAILNPLREEPRGGSNGKFYSDNRVPGERESDSSSGSKQVPVEVPRKTQVSNGNSGGNVSLPSRYQKSASYGPQKILDDTFDGNDSNVKSIPIQKLDYSDQERQSSYDSQNVSQPRQQQQQQVPFKSLVRSQKKSSVDDSQQGSAPSTSRSYQGMPGALYQQTTTTTLQQSKFQQISSRQKQQQQQQQQQQRQELSPQLKDSATDV